MQIVCPSCNVQYSIDDDAIPPKGRNVQCSACGKIWFQQKNHSDNVMNEPEIEDNHDHDEQAHLQDDRVQDDRGASAPSSSLAPQSLAVLKEEVERELQVRRQRAAQNMPHDTIEASAPEDNHLSDIGDNDLLYEDRSHFDTMADAAKLRDTDDEVHISYYPESQAEDMRDTFDDEEEVDQNTPQYIERRADSDVSTKSYWRVLGSVFLWLIVCVMLVLVVAVAVYTQPAFIARKFPALIPALDVYLFWSSQLVFTCKALVGSSLDAILAVFK